MLADTLEIHFVELPKFLDEQPELNNSLNRWLTFLTRPEKEVMEVVEMGEPAIKKAITVLDMLSRDPETVRLAELRMKKIMDEKSMIEGAKEEGKIEGIEEGRQEGIEIGEDRRAIKIAIKMLSRGDTTQEIIDVTELSEGKILELKKELGE